MKRMKIIILAIVFSEILFILNKSNSHIINTIQFNKVSNSNFKHILKNAFSSGKAH
jgi:predicted nucleic acid-binding protein